ncbi:hypothetical protein NMB32_17060 [Stenotrophomonas sp. CD2]|nr:hypothetical protein NMB32_17060 [Stenotrophomonas sp. CD2]
MEGAVDYEDDQGARAASRPAGWSGCRPAVALARRRIR